MTIYGKLILGEELHAASVALEKETSAGVYGVLASTNGVDPKDAPEPEAELPLSPLGEDYTVQQLGEALMADPSLGQKMLDAEVARPAGPRKMALRSIAEHSTDAFVKEAAELVLASLMNPEG